MAHQNETIPNHIHQPTIEDMKHAEKLIDRILFLAS